MSTMNCQDAREAYSRSEIGLTEKALVHAHVMQCTDCQRDRASLPLPVNPRYRVPSTRPARLPRLRRLVTLSATVSQQAAIKMLDGARSGATRAVDVFARVRGLGPVFVKLSERTAAGAIGVSRLAAATAVGLLTGLHAVLSVSASVAGRVVATSARVLLAGMRGLASAGVKGSERVAAGAIAAARFAMATAVGLLTGLQALRSGSASVAGRIVAASARVLLAGTRGLASAGVKGSERTAVAAIAATRFAMASSVALLTRLQALLSVSLTAFGRAGVLLLELRGPLSAFVKRSVVGSIGVAGTGIARTGHLLARLRAPVATSVTVSGQAAGRAVDAARAAAPVIGRAGFATTHVAHLALQGIARTATEAGRAAVTGGRASVMALRAWLSTLVTESGQAAGRLIAASREGIVRLRGPLAQVLVLVARFVARSERVAARTIEAAVAAGRVVVAPPARVRPILKASIGIAGFALLVAALLAAWPRPWRPDPVMAQREVRRPVERTPVEPAPAASRPVSDPDPTDTPRTAMRPRSAEARPEAPAPARRSTASAASPSREAVEGADAGDSTAAIDWLLKGGGGRRRIENP